jgi:hypothetical protein
MAEHNAGTTIRHHLAPASAGKPVHDIVVAARAQDKELVGIRNMMPFKALKRASHATDARAGLKEAFTDRASCVLPEFAVESRTRTNQSHSANVDHEVLRRAACKLLLRANVR